MVGDTDAQPRGDGGKAAFHTTRWSRVARAGRPEDPGFAEALEQLCQAYWFPVYAFVRRLGQSPGEAEDTVQAFFERLLEKNFVAQADPERGRFRTFLLAALKHHLSHQREQARAVKRGGRIELVSLEGEAAEQWFQREPATEDTPETLYERQWAETMLQHALWRLREEFDGGGKVSRFDRLKPFLLRRKETSYREAAADLGLTEGALKSAIHRMRERFVQILREEIGQTVATPEEVDAEIRHQLGLLAR